MIRILLGLLILIVLLFMGRFYYRSCKNLADELLHEYIEARDEK